MDKKEIIEWVKTIVYPVIIALIITIFVRPTIVKEFSMYPTLEENNYLILNKAVYMISEPKFKDIVVFKSDLETKDGKRKNLIKRVIGVPGDTIEIKDGIVYRNGNALKESYINGDYTPGYIEPTVIPEGKLFVMGDNRPNSIDSRDERVGLVDIDAVVGKAFLRLFPFNKIGFVE